MKLNQATTGFPENTHVVAGRHRGWMLTACCAGALAGMLCAPAHADFMTGKTHGGLKIAIKGPVGSAVRLITTARATGKEDPPEIRTHEQVIGPKGLTFNVPQTEEDSNGVNKTVVDYKLQVTPPGPPKLQFSLNVESFSPNGSDFIQNSVSDELFETLGDGVELRIPDFSADNGDTLYAAVNLADFIPADLNFSIGNSFTITDGSSPGLPGFVFGTSEILMDPTSANGFGDTDPFSGTITVAGENDPSATPIPEPASGFQMLISVLFLVRITIKASPFPQDPLSTPRE